MKKPLEAGPSSGAFRTRHALSSGPFSNRGPVRSGPVPELMVNSFPVNEETMHCTGAIRVNGNSPLTGRLLVTACRRRGEPLPPVTEFGRNGGSHE